MMYGAKIPCSGNKEPGGHRDRRQENLCGLYGTMAFILSIFFEHLPRNFHVLSILL